MPDRERATGGHFLKQAGADELTDNLSGGFASNIYWQLNATIIALLGCGQNDELGIGKFWHWGSS